MSFIDKLETELTSAGITILPPYEGDPFQIIPLQYTCGKNVTPIAFVEFLRIRINNTHIQFMPLKLHGKGLVEQLHRKGNIYLRYAEYTMIMSDEIEGRYDIMLRSL